MGSDDRDNKHLKRTPILEPEEDGSTLPANLPGINIAKGLENVRGKEPLYRKLIHTFCHDHQQDGDLLKRLLEADDIEQAQRVAHTLKGISGTIGAVGLLSASTALNSALLNGRAKEAIAPLIVSVESSLNQVIGSIETLELAQEFDVLAAPVHSFDEQTLKVLIVQLEELIDDMDPESINKATEICCQLEESSLKSVAMNMLGELEVFEFEKAMLSLRMLKQWIEAL